MTQKYSHPETADLARGLVQCNLSQVLRDLPQIYSVIAVAVAALRQQASELDEDIALVLQRGTADRIQEQVERIEAALAAVTDIA